MTCQNHCFSEVLHFTAALKDAFPIFSRLEWVPKKINIIYQPCLQQLYIYICLALKTRSRHIFSRKPKFLLALSQKMEKLNKQYCLVYILVASLTVMAMSSIEDDEKSCADQLTSLGACIPYVSGSAPKPTPQCCEDTKKVKNSQPKCLCVLIKESTDPSLGLPINTTLALKMPTACNIDAKVSDCPCKTNYNLSLYIYIYI